MRHFYFWQNMISIHQSSFLRTLAASEGNVVYLIVETRILESREKMGWKVPDLGKVFIISIEEDINFDYTEVIEESNRKERSLHIFSGIGEGLKTHAPLKYALKKGCAVAIMAESLDSRGLKGLVRLLISKFNKIRFGRKIRFWLTIGEQAYRQYNRKIGYSDNLLFDWAYCVEGLTVQESEIVSHQQSSSFNIVYVGSLFPWKGYDLLIDSLLSIKDLNFKADFYSINESSEHIAHDLNEKIVSSRERISLLPMIGNEDIRKKIGEYDLLVLPSRYDGWGTVINEALTLGTPVIVSENCGAAILAKSNPEIGQVSTGNSISDLAQKLEMTIKKGKWTTGERIALRNWAESNISGDALVPYFMNIVMYIDQKQVVKPIAPWLQKH